MFYSSFVCISAYANVYCKKTLWECLRAGLPPGFPSTAPPPERVSAVLGTLAVWIPNQKKKIVQVQGEDQDTPGDLRGDRVRRDVGDPGSWVRPPWLARDETPGP